jgi:hypothetical protein
MTSVPSFTVEGCIAHVAASGYLRVTALLAAVNNFNKCTDSDKIIIIIIIIIIALR